MFSVLFSDFNCKQYFDKDINIDDIVEIKITNHTEGVKNIWIHMKFVDGSTKNIHIDPCMETSMNIHTGIYEEVNESMSKIIADYCECINNRIEQKSEFILYLKYGCGLSFHLSDSNMIDYFDHIFSWFTYFEHNFCLQNYNKEINEFTIKEFVSKQLQQDIFKYLEIEDKSDKNANYVRSYIYNHLIISKDALDYIKSIAR